MKDKDPNDDELNKDQEDNINEADDSFGLPDLEFNELDEESAEEEPTHSDSEDADETEDSSDEEETTESYVEEESEADDAVEEEEPAKPAYVPPKPESNAPKIIAFLVIVVVATVAIWYFGFYRPQVAAEKARIEAANQKAEADALTAEKKREEEQRLAAEQAVNEAADVDEQASQESIFSTISESTGRYYIVIESFVDSDMAADYGNELATKGFSTALLSPQGKRKFHRLTVGDYETFVAAQEEANRLKAEFGEDLWVLKY